MGWDWIKWDGMAWDGLGRMREEGRKRTEARKKKKKKNAEEREKERQRKQGKKGASRARPSIIHPHLPIARPSGNYVIIDL